MTRTTRSKLCIGVLAVVAEFLRFDGHLEAQPAASGVKVSAFLRYSGHSAPRFERARRASVYVPVRDGVRRAVDIYLPVVEERVASGRLPVIYQSQRYVRAWKNADGSYDSPVAHINPDGTFRIGDGGSDGGVLSWFLRHGYAVVVADMRGAGASNGAEIEANSLQAGEDEYDIIEWIARQPWSDGNIGMIGISYGAESQLMAAGTRPPHLKALFPAAPEFDRFRGEAFVMGGIARTGWLASWLQSTQAANAVTSPSVAPAAAAMPPPPTRAIAPVDADRKGRLRDQAIEERRRASSEGKGITREFQVIADVAAGKLFWDDVPYGVSFQRRGPNHLANQLARIDSAQVPSYFLTGWFDLYTAGGTRYYNNLTMARRLVIGPWTHSPGNLEDAPDGARTQSYRETMRVEGLRWFDHWLRGIDNGVTQEPPITYAIMDSPERWFWRATDRWPPADAAPVVYFLAEGPSGTARSINNGLLTTGRTALERGDGRDEWRVDYTTTTGTSNRWIRQNPRTRSGLGGTNYGDLTPNDVKGLTYTTEPLTRDVVVAGHPIVTLYATSTAADGDSIVYLEEIDAKGVSHYRTEGMLRASHRVLGDPPYRYGGLPLPDSRRKIVEQTPPLSAGVAELTFELYPTANLFEKGHRIRVSVVGNDRGNTTTPILDPPPTVTLFHTSKHPSRIELPVLLDDSWRNTGIVGGRPPAQ